MKLRKTERLKGHVKGRPEDAQCTRLLGISMEVTELPESVTAEFENHGCRRCAFHSANLAVKGEA